MWVPPVTSSAGSASVVAVRFTSSVKHATLYLIGKPPGDCVEIDFATRKLADSLSSDRQRVRAFGAPLPKKLHLRLGQLSAATNLAIMRTLPGRCHELHGDRQGHLAIDVSANLRLIFRPTAEPPPSKDDGGLEWEAVKAITVLEVTDYHGE
jgi:proteic killer suppression protein